jgi:hypothetical protein
MEGGHMQFNFVWDASVNNAPAAFRAAVIAAGQQLASYFSDNITINIQVGWGESNGTQLGAALSMGGPITGFGVSYAQLVTDFARSASSGDDLTSVAFLQSISDPTHGGIFALSSAQEKAMGLLPAVGTAVDGSIGFSSGVTWDFNPGLGISPGAYDFNAAALHEITHAMGRIAFDVTGPNWYDTLDLFRFSTAGSIQLSGGLAAYFSPDGGQTHLDQYDTQSDLGDWALSVGADPFGEAASPGTLEAITAVDLSEMDVLGYHLSATGNAITHTTITVTAANATVNGTANDDFISATGGNTTITGGPGNDTIVAGAGINTCVYSGASNNYTVTIVSGASVYSVQDKVGTDGTDVLANIQRLQFTDQTLDATWFTKAAALPTAQFVDLIELYIAYFNRAPDAVGLDFWAAALHDGMSLQQIAKAFFSAPETIAAYPASQSTQDFVTEVYNNVLGRAPDTGGLNFWVNELQHGNSTEDSFMLNMIYGARASAANGFPADAQYLANKELVGAHFAIAQGLNDGTWSRLVMAGVDGTAASVTAANQLTDSFAATAATAHGAEFVVQLVGIAA